MPTIQDKPTEEKGLKILTSSKPLTRVPVSLEQIKAKYNSCN